MSPVSYKTEHMPVKRPGRGRITTPWLSSELKECFDRSNLCNTHTHTHTQLRVAVKNTKISLLLYMYFIVLLNSYSRMTPKHNPCPTVGYVQVR